MGINGLEFFSDNHTVAYHSARKNHQLVIYKMPPDKGPYSGRIVENFFMMI